MGQAGREICWFYLSIWRARNPAGRDLILNPYPDSPAYRGERSWWLQYSPARDQAPSAKAKESSVTMMAVGAVPAVAAVARPEGPEAGVRSATPIMHRAGPMKAMPCGYVAGGGSVQPDGCYLQHTIHRAVDPSYTLSLWTMLPPTFQSTHLTELAYGGDGHTSVHHPVRHRPNQRHHRRHCKVWDEGQEAALVNLR